MNCQTCKNYEPKEAEIWEPGNGFKYEWVDHEEGVRCDYHNRNHSCDTCPKINGKGCQSGFWKAITTEPLIVKSGGTWVKKEGGKNHFWNSDIYEPGQGYETDLAFWIPFPETLTDEHAKLRPMVMVWDEGEFPVGPVKLLGVPEGKSRPFVTYSMDRTYARLATPEELQEAVV